MAQKFYCSHSIGLYYPIYLSGERGVENYFCLILLTLKIIIKIRNFRVSSIFCILDHIWACHLEHIDKHYAKTIYKECYYKKTRYRSYESMMDLVFLNI